jgi:hypothetical protein
MAHPKRTSSSFLDDALQGKTLSVFSPHSLVKKYAEILAEKYNDPKK